MMDAKARPDLPEEIALVDEHSGEVVGTVDRHLAHTKGLWHASIHIWILDKSGNLLFQQRADWVRRFPRKWDVSAAGHMKVNESGLREVAEELGVEVDESQLEYLGILESRHDDIDFINRERPRVYLWRSGLELSQFSFPDEEAMGLASMSMNKVSVFLNGGSVPCQVLRNGHIATEYIYGDKLVPQSKQYWAHLQGHVRWDLPVHVDYDETA